MEPVHLPHVIQVNTQVLYWSFYLNSNTIIRKVLWNNAKNTILLNYPLIKIYSEQSVGRTQQRVIFCNGTMPVEKLDSQN